MIKFAPYITYEMDKCYFTQLECVGIIAIQMADWDADLSRSVLDNLLSLNFEHFYDKYRNQTIFDFGNYTAKFTFCDERNKVQLLIHETGYGTPIFTHIFTEDEMMGFVDYDNYHDPERLKE